MTVDRCGELPSTWKFRTTTLASFITLSVHICVQHDARMQRVQRVYIGYWFSVNRATSTFNISADFLIALNVLFNFHFKRTRVI